MKRREEVLQVEEAKSPEEQRPIQPAEQGVGPLYQRDYILTVRGTHCTPEAVMERLRREFPTFSPGLLATFHRPDTEDSGGRPLELGDTMRVHIHGAGPAGVLLVHRDARSLTLRTQEGHMEAGRITFGAYRDAAGNLVLRIRSRSRIRDVVRYAAYELFGKHAQTAIWTTFLQRWAEPCGGEQVGEVVTTMEEVPEATEDRPDVDTPTFEARDGTPQAVSP